MLASLVDMWPLGPITGGTSSPPRQPQGAHMLVLPASATGLDGNSYNLPPAKLQRNWLACEHMHGRARAADSCIVTHMSSW